MTEYFAITFSPEACESAEDIVRDRMGGWYVTATAWYGEEVEGILTAVGHAADPDWPNYYEGMAVAVRPEEDGIWTGPQARVVDARSLHVH